MQASLSFLRDNIGPKSERECAHWMLASLEGGLAFQETVLLILNDARWRFFSGLTASVEPIFFIRQIREFLIKRDAFFVSIVKVSLYPLLLIFMCCVVSCMAWFVFIPKLFLISGSHTSVMWIKDISLLFSYLSVIHWFSVFLVGLVFTWFMWRRISKRFRTNFSFSLGVSYWLLGMLMSNGVSMYKAICILKEHAQVGDYFRWLEGELVSGKMLEDVCGGMVSFSESIGLGARFMDMGKAEFSRSYSRYVMFLAWLKPGLICVVGILIFGLVYIVFVPLMQSLQNI